VSGRPFAGRRAFVTGGSRGIGAAIARRLASEGARVFLGYRDDEASAKSTAAAIEAAGGAATPLRGNLAHPDEIRASLEEIGRSGGLDVLVHAAALGSFKPVLDVKPNQWDLTLAVNARAFLLLAKESLPLLASPGGRIVGVSSLGSTRVVPEYGAIGASKAALEALVRALAVELGPKGITVNAVSAGVVDSGTIRKHPHGEELVTASREKTPLERLASEEDVAGAVLYLAGPDASFMTGQTLVLDGGFSLVV
jgi:enoyl-[acyl-carrier protein] reductase III